MQMEYLLNVFYQLEMIQTFFFKDELVTIKLLADLSVVALK